MKELIEEKTDVRSVYIFRHTYALAQLVPIPSEQASGMQQSLYIAPMFSC